MQMRFLSLAFATALVGCTTTPPPPQSSEPAIPSKAEDQCGARALSALVGQPVSQAPQPGANRHIRVVAEGDPVTMDYAPQRLNIYYERSTGRITRIKCG